MYRSVSEPNLLRAAMLGAVAASVPAMAAGEVLAVSEPAAGAWRFSVTPYLFLPVVTEGTAVIDGLEADVDLSLGDVLDTLQGALSFRAEAWNGDWGIITDVYYVFLEDDGSGDLPNDLGTVDVTSTVKQAWISLMGAYRFAEGETAQGQRFAFSGMAGVRWNSLEQTLDIKVNGPPGSGFSRGDSLGGTETWFEPVVGFTGAIEVAERWTLGARAEFSGFGVNGDDLQYLVLAGVDWRAWERTSIKLGYQFYGIDFSTDRSDGEFAYDVDQNGAYLGLTFRF